MQTYGITIALLLTLFLQISCSNDTGVFIVKNGASEPIRLLTVDVASQEFKYSNIEVQGDVSGTYEVKSDAHFELNVEFESGLMHSHQVGYITHGFSYKQSILVTDSDVVITDFSVD